MAHCRSSRLRRSRSETPIPARCQRRSRRQITTAGVVTAATAAAAAPIADPHSHQAPYAAAPSTTQLSRTHRAARTSDTSSRSAARRARNLHAPPDPVQQQIRPGQGVVHREPAADHLGDPRERSALILIPPRRGRADVQHRLQLAQLRSGELALRGARTAAASARRHRFADIRLTRNRRATSRSLAPV
jgi:hypothetical protein